MADARLAQVVFSGSENKSATELGGALPLSVNVIPDGVGALRRRPGQSPFAPAPSATCGSVIGIVPFGEWLVFVTEDRKFWTHNPERPDLGTVALSSDDVATHLDGQAMRACMVAGRGMLVASGGGAIQKWTGMNAAMSNLTARLTNTGVGGPPPSATFICAIAQRLVAQYATQAGQIWWSGPLEDYENWDMVTGGAGFIQAAAKPDPIVALFDNTNEVFAFGSETLQVFAPAALAVDVNDPNNLLDFAPARTQNIGTVSPYSVVAIDDTFAMLDRQRRFVRSDGRSYDDISRAITALLNSLSSIGDVYGFRMRFDRFDCVVWMFPSDGFGLVYDMQTGGWSEWRERSTVAGVISDVSPSITCAYNWAEKGVFVLGMSDGSLRKLDASSALDRDGTAIRVEVVSGFTDHGSTAQKHCKTLLLKFKRTWAAQPTSGHVRISKRDDQGAWKIIRDIELSADPNPAIQIRSLGVYRTRQWKVEYTGIDELQLVSAQEEFEVLGA